MSKILGIRDKELQVLRKGAVMGAITYIMWFCSSFIVSSSFFSVLRVFLHVKYQMFVYHIFALYSKYQADEMRSHQKLRGFITTFFLFK